jgi:hypothetical protein
MGTARGDGWWRGRRAVSWGRAGAAERPVQMRYRWAQLRPIRWCLVPLRHVTEITRRRPAAGGGILSERRPTLCLCRVTTTDAARAATRSRSAARCATPPPRRLARRGTPTRSSCCRQSPSRPAAAAASRRCRTGAAAEGVAAAPAAADCRAGACSSQPNPPAPRLAGSIRVPQPEVNRLVTSRVVPSAGVDGWRVARTGRRGGSMVTDRFYDVRYHCGAAAWIATS